MNGATKPPLAASTWIGMSRPFSSWSLSSASLTSWTGSYWPVKVTPSVGNFILIHFPTEKGRDAASADELLKSRGIILRRVAAYGLPNALRMTIGTEEANRLVIDGLRDLVAGT